MLDTTIHLPSSVESESPMILHDAVNLFLQAKGASLRAPATLDWYHHQLGLFVAWLESERITGDAWFDPATLAAYLAHRHAKGLKEATVEGSYRALSAFFRWLRKRKLIRRDLELPTELIDRPHVPRRRQRRVEAAEFDRLLDSVPKETWIDHRDRLLITTLFLCAIRREECVRLEVDDYQLGDRLLLVRRSKGGDERVVPMLKEVAQEFAQYMIVRPAHPSPRVFLSSDGTGGVKGELTGSGLHQRLKTRCAAAGIRFLNPHAFRHGLAIYLLNRRGAQMSLIQQILGHKKITTTAQIYALWEQEGIAREYLKLMEGKD